MAIPRSTANSAPAPSAVANFTFANVTFTAVGAGATVSTVLNLPRSFKPQKAVQVVIAGLQSGLTVGQAWVSGNAPSCSGCSPANYQLNIPISNATAGTLTPTAQKIFVTQD